MLWSMRVTFANRDDPLVKRDEIWSLEEIDSDSKGLVGLCHGYRLHQVGIDFDSELF